MLSSFKSCTQVQLFNHAQSYCCIALDSGDCPVISSKLYDSEERRHDRPMHFCWNRWTVDWQIG